MTAPNSGHGHGHEHTAPTWDGWAVFDALVWAAVGVLAILAAEWLFGATMRAWMTRQATSALRQAQPAEKTE